MYQVGDLLFYENTGVCRVMDIMTPGWVKINRTQLFYVLEPLYQNYTIFIPVNSTKVFMRSLISKDEAKKLIDRIPTLNVEIYNNCALNKFARYYEEAMKTHNCLDLLIFIISIYEKKQVVEQQNHKLGSVDKNYMTHAEGLLYGELAAVLNLPKDKVSEYIIERINNQGRENCIGSNT
jgi:CarD family transcriptional regulator